MASNKVNVLSLFDGISCGQQALERLGVEVGKYYASEIDKYAISITQKNYPDTIQLGDVTKWREWDIDWASIDLIMGGSPCQGFSMAGKQLAFDDPRSALFFVFVDIRNHIQKHNPDVKFLLENVRMKKDHLAVITEYMGVEPVMINSALVSAQNRRRLYWTNIPLGVTQPADKGEILSDILVNAEYEWLHDEAWNYANDKPSMQDKKAHTLRAQAGGKTKGVGVYNSDCTKWRKMTPVECERLQTLPDNYTEGASNSQRYKMLGNGWTVDVIKHIFGGLYGKQ